MEYDHSGKSSISHVSGRDLNDSSVHRSYGSKMPQTDATPSSSPSSSSPSKSSAAITGLFSDFTNTTTTHGLPRITMATSVMGKLYWLVLFLGCLGVASYQGQKLVRDYFSYPYSTKVDIVTQSKLEFPAITICNVNMMRRSMLVDTRFEDLINADGHVDASADDDYSWWFDSSFYERLRDDSSLDTPTSDTPLPSSPTNGRKRRSVDDLDNDGDDDDKRVERAVSSSVLSSSVQGEHFFDSEWVDSSFDFNFYDNSWDDISVDSTNIWEVLVPRSRFPDFSDIRTALNPTKDELRAYGHQREDFILQCVFDRQLCSSSDFEMFQHGHYGNCFTFNGRTMNEFKNKTRSTGKTGSQYGLHLTLFVEQPEYLGMLSHESGVRVSIHPSTQKPFPEDDGLTASTGQKTTVSLRQLNITRLGGQYGHHCTRNGEQTNFSSESQFSYTVNECQKQCQQDELYKICGCISDIRFSNLRQCNSLNDTEDRCRQLTEYLFDRGTLGCECPIACNVVSYIRSISTALWPSERYEEHLAEQLALINNKTTRILSDVERTRKNLVNLVVYFEHLNYEHNQQLAVYTVESLFAAVGGISGLYLGMSFISFGEIIALFSGIFWIFGRSSCPSPSNKNVVNGSTVDHETGRLDQGAKPSAKKFDDVGAGSKDREAMRNYFSCLIALVSVCVAAIVGVVVALVVLVTNGSIVINT